MLHDGPIMTDEEAGGEEGCGVKAMFFVATGNTAQRPRRPDELGKHIEYPWSKPTHHGFTKS